MPLLPIVLPFVLGGFEFTDARTDPALAAQVGAAMTRFVESIVPPRDLLCSVGSVKQEDRRLARLEAWNQSGNRFVEGTPELDIESELLAAQIEKYRQIDQLRHTLSVFQGDVNPLNFALSQGPNFVGAWQWYGIRIVSEDTAPGGVIEVRAGWFPVLLDTTNRQLANRSIDLVDLFVRRGRKLELEDGRFLDIVQATASTVEDVGRDDTELITFARERLERNAGRGQLKLSSRAEVGGRRRLRVTAFDRDPIDEPEIEALERDRRE